MELSEETCPCLSLKQIEGLKEGGIITAMNFLLNSKDKVMACGMLSNMQYELLKQSFFDRVRPVAVTAKNLVIQEDLLMSTGIQGLDKVLGGGLIGGEILEIYGRPDSCKTQLSMRIAAEFCHFRPQPFCVVYFDLKNDFRATRFRSICEGNAEALKNVFVIRSSTFAELLEDIQILRIEINAKKSFHSNIKLVIFDSLPMVVYPAVAEEVSTWRFQLEMLFNEVSKLKNLNDGIAVVMINHAVKFLSKSAWNQGESGSGYKSAMGKFWNHKPDLRLYTSVEHQRLVKGRCLTVTLDKSTRTESKKQFRLILLTDGTLTSNV